MNVFLANFICGMPRKRTSINIYKLIAMNVFFLIFNLSFVVFQFFGLFRYLWDKFL